MDAGLVTERQDPRVHGVSADGIEELYRARLGAFVRVAAAITGDRDSARDAVHDAFAAILRARGDLRDEAALEAWVWTAVVNRARNQRRGRGRRMRHEGAEVRGDPPAPGAADPDPEVRAMVAELPERQRLTLFLRYFADLDYATIAAATGVEIGTVGATLSAAHATLRRTIERGGPR